MGDEILRGTIIFPFNQGKGDGPDITRIGHPKDIPGSISHSVNHSCSESDFYLLNLIEKQNAKLLIKSV